MASPRLIPLARPSITDEDISAVESVLRSGQLSLGSEVEKFEKELALQTGTSHAVAVANGTCGLHLIIRALGIGPGDEVITTPFSFIASSNCILFEGATPVFADIDRLSFNLDPTEVEKKITPRTKAILAVDVFGRLADWAALTKIANKHGIALIEDSCEALGTPHAGTFGRAGTFGFYPNKQITSGEGGAIVTNDGDLAARFRAMRNQGRRLETVDPIHDSFGFNYRLSDVACALLTSQLKRFPSLLEARLNVAKMYSERLKSLPLRLPMSWQAKDISWFVYVVELPEQIPTGVKERIIEELRENGIGAGSYFVPIHLQPYYKRAFGTRENTFPNAEYLGERTIALPFFADLTDEQNSLVCTTLTSALKKHRIVRT